MQAAAEDCDSFINYYYASKKNMATNYMADELRHQMPSACRTPKKI